MLTDIQVGLPSVGLTFLNMFLLIILVAFQNVRMPTFPQLLLADVTLHCQSRQYGQRGKKIFLLSVQLDCQSVCVKVQYVNAYLYYGNVYLLIFQLLFLMSSSLWLCWFYS